MQETPERQGVGAAYNAPGAPHLPEGDQIKDIGGNRWDVAPRGTEGAWCRVSFAGEGPACECIVEAIRIRQHMI